MIFKKIRAWWNKGMFSDNELVVSPPPTTEPQEVWQWQINCVSDRYPWHAPIPQNFGLLIGTSADAEARLKASVSLPNYYETYERMYYSSEIKTYEFRDPDQLESNHLIQRGAIRCVSENMKLLRTGTPFRYAHTPFIVEAEGYRDLNSTPSNRKTGLLKVR